MPPRLRQFYKFVWWDFLSSGRVLGAFKGSQNTRNVAAQFPRLKVAHESYQSSDYQSAIKLGKGGFHHSFVIIECVE